MNTQEFPNGTMAKPEYTLSLNKNKASFFSNPRLPDDTKRIYLIRHAQAERDANLDPKITGKGYIQLQALQTFFQEKDLDLIITSELYRAKTTAQALLAYHSNVPIVIDGRLNEIHTVGNWRELSEEDVLRLVHEKMYKPDHFCERGESPRHFHRRIADCWKNLIHESAHYDARNIAIVAHNDVLRVIVSLAFGVREEDEVHFTIAYPHAAVSELWIVDRRADSTLPDWITAIKYLCCSSFLQEDLITY